MSSHHNYRPETVYVAVLLDKSHLICRYYDIQHLYNFRRLDTYSGKSDPSFVSCSVVLSEKNKQYEEADIYHAKPLPVFSKDIGIYNCKEYKGSNSEDY